MIAPLAVFAYLAIAFALAGISTQLPQRFRRPESLLIGILWPLALALVALAGVYGLVRGLFR